MSWSLSGTFREHVFGSGVWEWMDLQRMGWMDRQRLWSADRLHAVLLEIHLQQQLLSMVVETDKYEFTTRSFLSWSLLLLLLLSWWSLRIFREHEWMDFQRSGWISSGCGVETVSTPLEIHRSWNREI